MSAIPAKKTGEMHLKRVRLAFAQGLFTPNKGGSTDPAAKDKYNCALLIKPDDLQVAAIKKCMQEVARDAYKEEAVATYNALAKMDKLALHDGDTKPKYTGYPGMLYLNPNTTVEVPPTLIITIDGVNCTIDTYKNDKVEQVNFQRLLRAKFYSGCYVNASVSFWAQKLNHKHGPRINVGLRGLQFAGDGDAFGGGGQAADPNEFGIEGEAAVAESADGFADEIG